LETAPESAAGGRVLHALHSDFMTGWKPGGQPQAHSWRRVVFSGMTCCFVVQRSTSNAVSRQNFP
jgi:hypothetical protein